MTFGLCFTMQYCDTNRYVSSISRKKYRKLSLSMPCLTILDCDYLSRDMQHTVWRVSIIYLVCYYANFTWKISDFSITWGSKSFLKSIFSSALSDPAAFTKGESHRTFDLDHECFMRTTIGSILLGPGSKNLFLREKNILRFILWKNAMNRKNLIGDVKALKNWHWSFILGTQINFLSPDSIGCTKNLYAGAIFHRMNKQFERIIIWVRVRSTSITYFSDYF